MEIKEILKKIEESDIFKDWKKDNPQAELAHVFASVEEEKEEFEVGYYNKETNKITSFSSGDTIQKMPESEIFKKENDKLKLLDLAKINITFKEASEKAEELQKEKYPVESAVKKFIVLQNLDVGQVYNITYVTKTLKTLNIKIDSNKGDVISDELISIVQFNPSSMNS